MTVTMILRIKIRVKKKLISRLQKKRALKLTEDFVKLDVKFLRVRIKKIIYLFIYN